jgi:hypothetical protein
MFHTLQETWVESLKRHLSAWKKEAGYSEMTMFDEIVKAHERIGGPQKTGIHFSDGKDEYNRQKANAIRIKRLLVDDEEGIGREQADQLVNLMPSILAAMPAHLRISFLNEYLAPLELHVAGNEEATEGDVGIADLAEIMHQDAKAQQSFAAVLQSQDINTLTEAHKAILESIETKKRKGRFIAAMIRAKTATGSAIKKMFHRKAHAKVEG